MPTRWFQNAASMPNSISFITSGLMLALPSDVFAINDPTPPMLLPLATVRSRPPYGVRDLTVASGNNIGGVGSLIANTSLGNANIKPEVMNEMEFGIDAAFWNQRVGIEATHYERVIKDLLLQYPLPPSSGLSIQTINGGQISTRGFEGSITLAVISKRDLEWTFK